MTERGPDDVVILCFRTTRRDVLIVDGASKTACETCGKEVWIAPSSRKIRQERKVRVVCDRCARLEILSRPGEVHEILPLSAEQKQEIVDALENRKSRN